jgi:hypothetical protein
VQGVQKAKVNPSKVGKIVFGLAMPFFSWSEDKKLVESRRIWFSGRIWSFWLGFSGRSWGILINSLGGRQIVLVSTATAWFFVRNEGIFWREVKTKGFFHSVQIHIYLVKTKGNELFIKVLAKIFKDWKNI